MTVATATVATAAVATVAVVATAAVVAASSRRVISGQAGQNKKESDNNERCHTFLLLLDSSYLIYLLIQMKWVAIHAHLEQLKFVEYLCLTPDSWCSMLGAGSESVASGEAACCGTSMPGPDGEFSVDFMLNFMSSLLVRRDPLDLRSNVLLLLGDWGDLVDRIPEGGDS